MNFFSQKKFEKINDACFINEKCMEYARVFIIISRIEELLDCWLWIIEKVIDHEKNYDDYTTYCAKDIEISSVF
jgi:hypothetical protein